VNITGDQVSFRYEPEAPLILDRVMFSLSSGDFVLLIGTNGAGKTTFLKLLAGILSPSSGRLVAENVSSHGLLLPRLGFLPHWSVQDVIGYWKRQTGAGEDEARAVSRQWGFESRLGKRVCELSQGWQKRLALVRIFLRKRDVYLLDEPQAGLDADAVDLLGQVLMKRKEEGAAILATTPVVLTFKQIKQWTLAGGRLQT
jgi:heme exporter protein A